MVTLTVNVVKSIKKDLLIIVVTAIFLNIIIIIYHGMQKRKTLIILMIIENSMLVATSVSNFATKTTNAQTIIIRSCNTLITTITMTIKKLATYFSTLMLIKGAPRMCWPKRVSPVNIMISDANRTLILRLFVVQMVICTGDLRKPFLSTRMVNSWHLHH